MNVPGPWGGRPRAPRDHRTGRIG